MELGYMEGYNNNTNFNCGDNNNHCNNNSYNNNSRKNQGN